MEKFKSKIDFSIVLFFSLVFGGILVRSLFDKRWIMVIIISFVIVFIVHMFSTTYYCIESEKLTIKCGFLIKKTLYIKDIKRISESYDIISSPALSFNRLEILYNKFDTILISPKDKSRFINAIEKINPDVEVKVNPKM